MTVFHDELDPAPRSWAERAYPKLIHYNKLDKGGHFAAREQPQLFFRRGSRGLQTAPLVGVMEAPLRARLLPVPRRGGRPTPNRQVYEGCPVVTDECEPAEIPLG